MVPELTRPWKPEIAPQAIVTTQQRHDRRRPRRDVGIDRRRDYGRSGDEDRAVQDAEADEELDAVDVVARLQQQPDRQHRRHRGVGEQDQDPLRGRRDAGRLCQRHREQLAQVDDRVEDDRPHHRRPGDPDAHLVEQDADADRHDDGGPGWYDARRRVDELVGDRDREDRVHHQQRKKTTIMNRLRARWLTTSPVSEPTDSALLRTLAQMAPKVVHAGEEHRADDHPEESRQPAPHDGDARADDRRGRRRPR